MPKGQYTWDTATRTYMQGGRAVSPEKLRSWVELTTDAAKERLSKIAEQYRAGEINLAQWRISAGDEIKRLHSSMAMMANGGRAQMTPQAWGRLGAKLKTEFERLNAFRNELTDMKPEELKDGFVSRTRAYANGAVSTYENLVKAREVDAGVKRARRILEDGAEHCAGCLSEASDEFRPIEEVADIGTQECNAGDRCRIEYEYEAEAD